MVTGGKTWWTMVKKYVKIWPWHHRGPLFAIIAPIPFVWLKPDGTLRGSIQNSECMRRVLQLWLLWLVSFAKSWYFSALIVTSSIIQTRLLDTFIVVLVQFLVRFSDSQIMNSSHVPGVHDKRLAEFLVVRGSQHRRKSHWAANYVSGSDSSRNGR